MKRQQRLAAIGGWGLVLAAGAWPSIAGALAWAMLSPYERALAQSWCGVAPHDALTFLGHCAPCWASAAALALSGFLLLSKSGKATLAPAAQAAAQAAA